MNMIYRHRGILSVFFGAVCFSFAGVLIKMIDWPAVPSYGGRSFFTFFAILGYMVKKSEKTSFFCHTWIYGFIRP